MASTESKHPGTLHRVSTTSPLVAFEHATSLSNLSSSADTSTLIFLGGLFDGLLTVPFVPPIVKALPPSWTLIEPVLSSSYKQWGFSSLGEDVKEIALVVEYFRKLRPNGKIVLMGHSTGSQQLMHYLLTPTHPKIEGGIFQSSISDREALTVTLPLGNIEAACAQAQSYVKNGIGDDILPSSITSSKFQSAPISANRWLSLASPGPEHAGEDDYFSSDFADERLERTFGKLGESGTRLCFLYGGSDQHVPATVNKEKLVGQWHEHIKKRGGVVDEASGIVEGASHTLKEGGKALEELVGRVVSFLLTSNMPRTAISL